MKSHILILPVILAVIVASSGAPAFYQRSLPGEAIASAAEKYVATLTDEQKKAGILPYDSKERVGWHFIPKPTRKGVQLKEMNAEQQKAALGLLRAALSQSGYDKTRSIMSLEIILDHLEQGKPNRNIRDPQRYFFTLFGQPGGKQRWGLSVEGHHLSLNFVLEGSKVVSSTPEVFGANPAIVKSSVDGGAPLGTRVLGPEEQLAFDLLGSLSPEQLKVALIAEKAPTEVRAAGESQPPADAPVGIPASRLDEKQQKTLRALLDVYCQSLPAEVAADRLAKIESDGVDKVHFAWAGATKPGVGHYYRVQGPSFAVEFVNTQPDAAGNIANHIHCQWRNLEGDFGLPVKK